METLSEIDIELAHKAKELGLKLHRAPSLNDDPVLSFFLLFISSIFSSFFSHFLLFLSFFHSLFPFVLF